MNMIVSFTPGSDDEYDGFVSGSPISTFLVTQVVSRTNIPSRRSKVFLTCSHANTRIPPRRLRQYRKSHKPHAHHDVDHLAAGAMKIASSSGADWIVTFFGCGANARAVEMSAFTARPSCRMLGIVNILIFDTPNPTG